MASQHSPKSRALGLDAAASVAAGTGAVAADVLLDSEIYAGYLATGVMPGEHIEPVAPEPTRPQPANASSTFGLLLRSRPVSPGPMNGERVLQYFYGSSTKPDGFWIDAVEHLPKYLIAHGEGDDQYLEFTHDSTQDVPKGSASTWWNNAVPLARPSQTVELSMDIFMVNAGSDRGQPLKSGKFGGLVCFHGGSWPGASKVSPKNASLRFCYHGNGQGYEQLTAYAVAQPVPGSYKKNSTTSRYPNGEWHIGRGITREWPIGPPIWNEWFNTTTRVKLNTPGKADGYGAILVNGNERWSRDNIDWVGEGSAGWNIFYPTSMIGGNDVARHGAATPNRRTKVRYSNFRVAGSFT